MLSVFAPAKINLSLHITGKKNTAPFIGYHTMESLVSFVDIGDRMTLVPNNSGDISITTSGTFAPHIPTTHDNLVARAIDFIRPNASYGCTVHIEKNLPVGAGIGGGSSDAGAVLRTLATYWNIDTIDMARMTELGADIPMCYHAKDVLATHIGDHTVPIQLPPYHIVLMTPHVHVSTPHIYEKFHTYSGFSNAPAYTHIQSYDDFIDILHQGKNDLATVCESMYPQVAQCLHHIKTTQPDYANISGSGGTCFAIYRTRDNAINAIHHLKNTESWIQYGTRYLHKK